MRETEEDSQPVRSSVLDVGNAPLSSMGALYTDEVNAIVRRIVDDAQLPTKPPVAAFSSCILSRGRHGRVHAFSPVRTEGTQPV